MYSDIRISHSGSTFAAQVEKAASVLPGSPRSICDAIAAMWANNVQQHGGDEALAVSSAATPEWNQWAVQNGCPQPAAGRGVAQHPDITQVDAAVKAVIKPEPAGTGNLQNQLEEVSVGGVDQVPDEDEGFDWLGWATTIWGVIGRFFQGRAAAWSYGSDMTPTDRLRASGKTAIAPLLPGALSGLRRVAAQNGRSTANIPEWAYWTGEEWRLDYRGLVGAPDADFPPTGLNLALCVGSCPGEAGSAPGTGAGGPVVMPGNASTFFGPAAQPRTIMVRRCPGPMRLAIDNLCYHKDLLPDKYRQNKPKPAPVSHADAQNIRKGDRAKKRIHRYAEKYEGHSHHRHR